MKRKAIILRAIGALMLSGVYLFYCPAMQGARGKLIYINMNGEKITSDHPDQERVEVKKPDRGS